MEAKSEEVAGLNMSLDDIIKQRSGDRGLLCFLMHGIGEMSHSHVALLQAEEEAEEEEELTRREPMQCKHRVRFRLEIKDHRCRS